MIQQFRIDNLTVAKKIKDTLDQSGMRYFEPGDGSAFPICIPYSNGLYEAYVLIFGSDTNETNMSIFETVTCDLENPVVQDSLQKIDDKFPNCYLEYPDGSCNINFNFDVDSIVGNGDLLREYLAGLTNMAFSIHLFMMGSIMQSNEVMEALDNE